MNYATEIAEGSTHVVTRKDIYDARHDADGWWAEFYCGARIGPYKVLHDLERNMTDLGFKTLTSWGEG